jgi:hypothetical protein
MCCCRQLSFPVEINRDANAKMSNRPQQFNATSLNDQLTRRSSASSRASLANLRHSGRRLGETYLKKKPSCRSSTAGFIRAVLSALKTASCPLIADWNRAAGKMLAAEE